jgi:hypothetical protein
LTRAALAALLAVAVVAACGGGEQHGKAALWVTRDRGADVLIVRTVDAGQTALQALDRVADVETRYGGRFVQAIDGVAGSLSDQRDWFYFVNGIEGDRSAAEYRLHPGDVLWWDYRSWAETMRAPVVVGAFPEPFLHGYDGKRREACVLYELPRLRRAAEAIARRIRARATSAVCTPGANVLEVTFVRTPFHAESGGPDRPVTFRISGADALRLAENPRLARFHYAGLG